MRLQKKWPSSSTFRRRHRTWSFHVLVLKRTAEKCSKIYNARAQLLFSSLNLLFSDVLVAVVVVVCLSSLFFCSDVPVTLPSRLSKLPIRGSQHRRSARRRSHSQSRAHSYSGISIYQSRWGPAKLFVKPWSNGS